MASFRPPVSFLIGTACGVVVAIILFATRDVRPVNWLDVAVDLRQRIGGGDGGNPSSFARHADVDADSQSRRASGSQKLGKELRRARKIFLDCGGNAASSVYLFLDTYPDGECGT